MRKMKDSGIEWIGMIPENWDIRRAKYNIIISHGSDPKTEEGDTPVYGSGAGSFKTCQEFKKGPIVLIGRKGSLNIPHYIEGNYWNVDTAFDVQAIKGKYDLRFYYYCAINFDYDLYLTHTALPSMTQGDYYNMRLPLLPLPEQRAIAEYLDKRCGEIDSAIGAAKELIEEYKEYKRSLITEAVTKGLDSKVKTKDSGVEWIGKIPEYWVVKKLKYAFDFGKGLPITKANLEDSGVAVISYGQIHSKKNTGTRIDDCLIRYVNESYLRTNSDSLTKKTDFLFADTSEDLDGCGNCVYVDKDIQLFAGYHTIILRNRMSDDAKYFAYLFKTDCWRRQLREIVWGVKLFSVTQRILMQASIIMPPLSEQKAIVAHLDEKCSLIDSLISEKESLVSELEEYKKSLIFECVTGKKEIA